MAYIMPVEVERHYRPIPEAFSGDAARLYSLDNGITDLVRRSEWCGFTGNNMVGALVFAANTQTFEHLYDEMALPKPRFLVEPISQHRDVPLYYQDKQQQIHQADISAKHVLVKHVSGRVAGLVTQGDTAGVILERMKDKDPEEGMLVVHLWQHVPFSEIFPYGPKFGIALPAEQWNERYGFFEKMERLGSVYDQLVNATIGQIAGKMRNRGELAVDSEIRPMDVFFDLCDAQGIPVDKEKFLWMKG